MNPSTDFEVRPKFNNLFHPPPPPKKKIWSISTKCILINLLSE